MNTVTEVEQPSQSEGLREFDPQNSEGVDSLEECIILPGTFVQDVELRADSITSESITKSSEKAIPGFMIAITLIQVCVFYSGGNFAFLYLGYDPSRRHEFWRLLTILFVHSSASHLWGNMSEQIMCGLFLEIYHHWKRTAIIYTAGVLGGTLFITILEPNTYGEGASAGVFALYFAHVATIVLNWDKMNYKYCRLLFIFVCIIYGVVQSPRREQHPDDSKEKTSHVGHLGGAVTGFLISILALKIFVERPWKKTLQKICAITLITLTLIIVIINFAFPIMYTQSEFNTDYEKSYIKSVFQFIDNTTSWEPDSESPLLVECLNVKECAEAWAEYKNTGEVTNAQFIYVLSENFH